MEKRRTEGSGIHILKVRVFHGSCLPHQVCVLSQLNYNLTFSYLISTIGDNGQLMKINSWYVNPNTNNSTTGKLRCVSEKLLFSISQISNTDLGSAADCSFMFAVWGVWEVISTVQAADLRAADSMRLLPIKITLQIPTTASTSHVALSRRSEVSHGAAVGRDSTSQTLQNSRGMVWAE